MTQLTFDLAIGKNRLDTRWRTVEYTWEGFCQRLSKTFTTPETVAEFAKSTKARKLEIKDIGGFVGGRIVNGRRIASNIAHRQLVTLDVDGATIDIWADFILNYSCAALLYSTHSHTPEKPCLRLIIPLDREVNREEYEAIARRIAGDVDIEQFDASTFQPERMMFWPSTPVDGEYRFEIQEGEILCADEVLSRYKGGWQDVSNWPVSAKGDVNIRTAMKKQGDPLEKEGWIGAFCQVYSIEEAIDTFLAEQYEACDVPNRYTYKHGTTAAGLTLYEGKFAYSFHGTDPAQGKLCNAFDLVRIHKFGEMDLDAKEKTPTNRMPSFIAMIAWVGKDQEVCKHIIVEKADSAFKDFADYEIEEQEEATEDNDWMGGMDMDAKGNFPLSTIHNILLVLKHDPQLKDVFGFNLFEKREAVRKSLPWRKFNPQNAFITDADLAHLRHWLEKKYGINHQAKTEDALTITCHSNAFHPIKEYIEAVEWDGVPRIDNLLIDYMGAEDSDYSREVIRKLLVAAVARIYTPGVKFDTLVVLVGAEGQKKSWLADTLGGQWFSDSLSTVKGKDAYEQLQGAWIIEIAELSALKKGEVEDVKKFFSKRNDRYRVAYGRRPDDYPRQCIFFGTTNEPQFLTSVTGNRRFWPVRTHRIEPVKDVADITPAERAQFWAEAYALYQTGEPLILSPAVAKVAFEKQAEHTERDERTGLVQKYLDTLLPESWDKMGLYDRRSYFTNPESNEEEGTIERETVCIAEVWCECLQGQEKDMTTANTKKLHDLMRGVPGWTEATSRQRTRYGLQKVYKRVKILITT